MIDEEKFNISDAFNEIFKRLDAIEAKIKEDASYDVESLDPDERSWYYEGDGTKRKKPTE